MKASRELRIGLLAFAIAWAGAMGTAAQTPTAQAPTTLGPNLQGAEAQMPPTSLPSYDEIVAMARGAKEATPGILAYRLVLRFSSAKDLEIPDEAYRLVKEADLALRFGGSPQEAGLQIRRMTAVSTRRGPVAIGMVRLMREEGLRSRLPGAAFGGPERAAGSLGPGLGRLSWSTGSGAAGAAAAAGGAAGAAGAGAAPGAAGGAPTGGPGSGHRDGLW